MRFAMVSGIVTKDAPLSYWPIFSPSLITFPKVFAKVNSAQFSLHSKVANGENGNWTDNLTLTLTLSLTF